MAEALVTEVVRPEAPLVESVVMIGKAALPMVRLHRNRPIEDLSAEEARKLALAIVRAADRADDLAAHFDEGLPGSVPAKGPQRAVR